MDNLYPSGQWLCIENIHTITHHKGTGFDRQYKTLIKQNVIEFFRNGTPVALPKSN
jgi:hypothetical protein